MAALREVIAKMVFDVDDAGLRKGYAAVSNLTDGFKKAAATVGAGMVLNHLRDQTTQLIEMGDRVGDASEMFGVSARELQRWEYIAESSGASAEGLGKSLRVIQKNAVEAIGGNKELAGAFKEIGVSSKDLKANLNDPSKLFELVGLRLSNLPTQADRTTAAMKLFGKAGAELVPIFNRGEEGIQQFSKRFDELGGGLSDDAVGALGEADQKLRDLELSSRRAKGELFLALAPAFTTVADAATGGIQSLAEMTKGTNALESAMGVLAATAAGAAVAAAAPYAPFIATAALAVASINDVYNAFKGKHSALLDWIGQRDENFGGTNMSQGAHNEAAKFGKDVEEGGLAYAASKFDAEDFERTSKATFEDRMKTLREGDAVRGLATAPDAFMQMNDFITQAVTERSADKYERQTSVFGRDINRVQLRGKLTDSVRRGANANPLNNAVDVLDALPGAGFRSAMLDAERTAMVNNVLPGVNPLASLAAQQQAFAPNTQPPKQDVKLDLKTNHTSSINVYGNVDPNDIASREAAENAKADRQSLDAARNLLVPTVAAR